MADKPRTTGVTQRWQYRVRLGAMEIAYFQKGNLPSKEIEESTFKPAGLIFDEQARAESLRWCQARGQRSGRAAYQFSKHWIGSQRLAASS